MAQTKKDSKELTSVGGSDRAGLFSQALIRVREDLQDSPYLTEALRVLPVGGFRSAIGCVWNAVVDDLRNKIIHRSLELFNKSAKFEREIKSYEDFQNLVNDDQLIDGAYKIGVIGWEASKVLRHAKETRHIFDGHPGSSDPSMLKVLAMLDDCVKYVLSEPYPPQIIDIDQYLTQLGGDNFDRNQIAIENALSDLPQIYKTELANRLFTAYIHKDASEILRSNIEFAAPILWTVLPKATRVQVAHRVDRIITEGDADRSRRSFVFIGKVGARRYLSVTARRYRVKPWIETLKNNLDKWDKEDIYVKRLSAYAGFIPEDLHADYVRALTLTYVGTIGGSSRFSRTDFYADGAALMIPRMFERFDDSAAAAFVEAVRTNPTLRQRITSPVKLARLRTLANIVLDRASESFNERAFLELLVDADRDDEFFREIGAKNSR
jgi:hypothetical protein